MLITNKQINQAALNTTLIHQSYSEYAKRFHLNYNELIVLYSLVTQKVCTQKQIGAIRELPKQTVHNICRKWIAEGIINVLDNSEDKREKNLTLSKKGQTLALPIIEPLLELEYQSVAEFGVENMHAFIHYFSTLQKIIAKNIGSK
ncbi:MarR family winged helix-turn-helix transcriptional regulator [Mannheimia massilioguelmaensis]|uniref:MarR family winged helix-turn-helix transcriptional regulator n=1 Tax=Mannheimia massilioguelmaensis TaxID=1604354 RepID=UPI0005C7FBCE|nr:MarR family winged helix-turn-helix transcriptional regulator [Mannheimia massilioguelmaensis]